MTWPLTGFWTDFGRVWRTTFTPVRDWRGWLTLLSGIVAPAVLAFVLTLIFVFRGTPADTVSSFVFFSTIYFFWTGLFDSCQTINGSIQSGEWAYWVLGTRRNAGSYLAAQVLCKSIRIAALTMAFSAVLLALCHWGQAWWTEALVWPWLDGVKDTAPTLTALFLGDELAAGPAESLEYVAWPVLWRFVWYHGLGLFMAGFAGVAIGLTLSGICREPIHSITGAIVVVMLAMILSFVSLNASRVEDEHGISAENRLTLSENVRPPLFLPVYYSFHAWQSPQGRSLWEVVWPEVTYPGDDVRDKDKRSDARRAVGNWVFSAAHLASYLLPQRYFFNLAHATIPRYGYLSRGSTAGGHAWDGVGRTYALGESGATAVLPCDRWRAKGFACPCVYCLGLVPTTVPEPFEDFSEAERQSLENALATLDRHAEAMLDTELRGLLAFCRGNLERRSREGKGYRLCWLDEQGALPYEDYYQSPKDAAPTCFRSANELLDVENPKDLESLTDLDREALTRAVAIVRGHVRACRETDWKTLTSLWAMTAFWEILALLVSVAALCAILLGVARCCSPIRSVLHTLR